MSDAARAGGGCAAELEGVRKGYGGLVAVDGLTLGVRRAEVLGLLGPNGAGKSTTIAMLAGLLRPDDGTVRVAGGRVEGDGGSWADPCVPAARRGIGLAPQALALYDDLTGEENLRFVGRLYGLGGARLRERVDRVLELVRLSDRRRDRVGTYSGGMKRRLNLASALLHEPALVLLDEPTAGVDPQSRGALFEVVRGLRRDGVSVVYSTHYMEEAERLCDRVAIVDHGRLLALGTVAEVLRAHAGPSVVLVERDGAEERFETDDPAAALAQLAREGSLPRVTIEGPSLESAFLALTGRRVRDA